ncbi:MULTISPECIES: hypothetical protein [Cupriavidus]|jgi:hypothetical protein|uniref:Uncharacterized protein n=1 Tax=Cupriavidus basilensis TaxID=68895 RepID=A0A643FR43_9BURK|nr:MULTISPECIES: hypothetical protein [Cupriavidus]KUE86394.1 hypothetical protein ASL20_23305 [Cupriavidus necator]NOV23594.1 hypothetical protein [Cupriavidus necator]QOT81668.1 hypothetical protein F7R26_037265 [Cupriavidus basilensis]BDB30121.1 hypothetical protein CTP10_R75380 [Cupriavidus sp. P-10]
MFIHSLSIEVGPVPADESCAQVGHPDYEAKSRLECAVYIRQLKRVFGNPDPLTLTFERRGFAHDLGRYHEVVAIMTAAGADLFDEAKVPTGWDAIARAELTWLRLQARWREQVVAGAVDMTEVPAVFCSTTIPDFPDHPVSAWWAMGFSPLPAGPAISLH